MPIFVSKHVKCFFTLCQSFKPSNSCIFWRDRFTLEKTNKLFIKGVSFAFYILIIFTALPLRHWNIYALTRHLLRRLVASTTYFRATHSDFVIIIGLWHRAKAAFCTMYSTLVYCSLVVLLLFQYVF